MSLTFCAELGAACNALGHYHKESNIYFSEDNLVEAAKDIIRYLRRDTDTHEVRRYFGDANIVEKNLVPLLKLYWEQTDLFDVLLRLLGNLTSPVLLLYNEEIPKDKTARHQFLQLLGQLQTYKHAFCEPQLWSVLSTRLSHLLNIEWQERGTENGLIIERILILIRNVLSIPADQDDEKRADNDVSAHDKVIWSLHDSGIVNTIHYMVSSDQEESYAMYLLEILSLMLREHRATDLAAVSADRTESERMMDEDEFTKLRNKELKKRQERMKNYTSARHSRFGGTFVFKNIKSVNDAQQLIYHKKLNTAESLNFDIEKSTAKIAKNRAPIKETTSHRRSPLSIRILLKEFCIEFLNSGYNKLMHVVRGKLVRGQTMDNDESYYMWALKFFMEFNRHYKFNIKLVSETIGQEIFHYIQQRMEHAYDMIFSDKKKWPLWSKRLHLALLAYRELLYNIIAMDKSTDSNIKENAKIIKSNIFYVVEYREFILQLLAAYDERKMSDAYLMDLIETQHIFLKMLEAYCGKGSGIVVQKIQKIKKKKKQHTAPTVSLEEALELKWDEVSPQLSTVLEGGENIPTMVPFDAASEVPINDQKKDAMIKIQDYLREGEVENAIGMLRAARDVWPDNDSFGSSSMATEEEFLAIREIFFTTLRDKEEMPTQPMTANQEDEEDEEDDEHGAIEIEREVDFKFQDFIGRFVQPKVIQACSLALRRFDTNTPLVNHCILKLLHRIAWDCKMPAMLFQASLFRTFQRIFEEGKDPAYKELVKFAIYIVRQFVRVAEKNKKVFMEILFWKNSKDAFDTEQGYGSYETNSKTMKKAWTEEEENELRVLVMEYKEKEIEEDAVDWLMNNLIDNTKSRLQIIRKLKELMLLDYTGKGKKSNVSMRAPKDWSEAEIVQITQLYEEFKDAMDPLSCIMDRLDVKRPKLRIKQKILDLGLADNKALRKKRGAKSKNLPEEGEENFKSRAFIDEDSDSDSSSSDEENEDRSNIPNSNPSQRATTTKKNRKQSRNSSKKPIRSQRLDLPILKKTILELIEKDMTDSLKWISECLTEAAEDQEQDINLDGDEGIPIVPINSKDVQAIKNPVFEKFLLGIGIQKPANEQEKFWRIPGNMPATELTNQAKFIDEIIEKGIEAFPEHNEEPIQNSSDDEDVFDRIRNFMSKPNNEEEIVPEEPEHITNQQLENENNEDDPIVEYDLQNGVIIEDSTNKSKKRITVFNDSDESENENTPSDPKLAEMETVLPTSKNSAKKSKKRITILDDSDESENENVISDSKSNEGTGSDYTENLTEMETVLPTSENSAKKSKKRITVLDDSDESENENILKDPKSRQEIPQGSGNENPKDLTEMETVLLTSKNSAKKSKKRITVLDDSDESENENILSDPKTKLSQGSGNKNPKDLTNMETILPTSENSGSKSKKRAAIYIDSDESENENILSDQPSKKRILQGPGSNNTKDLRVLETVLPISENSTKKSKKIITVLEDSDDSENDLTSENNESIAKRNRDSDSESESNFVKRKKIAIVDSDDE